MKARFGLWVLILSLFCCIWGGGVWNAGGSRAYAVSYQTNDWPWREERYNASNVLIGYTTYDYDTNANRIVTNQLIQRGISI